MAQTTDQPEPVQEDPQESWYKKGVIFLYIEMVIAILVSLYSLYMAFNGMTTAIGH